MPELAPPDAATATAVLGARSFAFEGEPIADGAADALARLRAMRLAFGQTAPTVRLVLQGRLDAPAIQRAFDLLTAAGFSRIAVEGRWSAARVAAQRPPLGACVPRANLLACCERSDHRPAPSRPRRGFADAYGQAAGRAFGSTRTALQLLRTASRRRGSR